MAYLDKSKGYYYVYVPKHPRANNRGYIKRSIVIIEQKLDRLLNSKYEHIHHINNNPLDDRIENLEILTPEHHSSKHGGRRKNPDKGIEKVEV